MNRLSRIVTISSVVLITLMPNGSALGISDFDAVVRGQDWYSQEDLTTNCSTGATSGTGNLSITLSGKDNAEKVWNFLIQQGFTEVQAAGIMGNFEAESGIDPTINERGKGVPLNNPTPTAGVGFGLAQWTPASRQKGLTDTATKMNVPVNTLEPQLAWFMTEITTDPTYKATTPAVKAATTVRDATEAFVRLFERPLVINENTITARTANGQKFLDTYGTGATPNGATGNAAAAGACGTTGGAVVGSITKTAMGDYTWPKPDCRQTVNTEVRNSCRADARDAYVRDADVKTGDEPLTDCGNFVGTVMRKSGADPNYPVIGTTTQIAYVRAHTEKYKVFENPTDINLLQPGDILIYDQGGGANGHTMIYLGKDGRDFPRADASWHGHTPQMNDAGGVLWILKQPNRVAARVLK
ncbi:MAG TPA: phage tail tip lysozyme [Candidatus Saccharimonadia bacterium]